jgi:hypothetical protein
MSFIYVQVANPAFISKNRRTSLKPSIRDVLEQHFNQQKWPSIEEISYLAETLQLEKKVLRVWFSNRRQKEKKIAENAMITAQTLSQNKQEKRISLNDLTQIINNPIEIDSYTLPLNLSIGKNCGNVKRFSLGKPNGSTQRRTVFVLGTRELIHKKFINQIINYIVDVKEEDPFRFELVEDESQSNCILVYDIHQTEGFRIPYSLMIVVTPYSGDWEDSERLFRDQKVAKMFGEFMEATDGIKELDMICNVTIKTSKIKQPFLSIFGKDIERNINNWELTADFLSDDGPWRVVVLHFFSVLAKMKPKSLLLTKSVLNERKKLENLVNRLQYFITKVSNKFEAISNTKKEMRHLQEQIKIDIISYNSLLPDLSVPDVMGFLPISSYDAHNNESLLYFKDLSKDVNRMYHEAEIKWNEIESKGRYLLDLQHKELLENGSALKENCDQTWHSIQQLNKIALRGNSGNSFLTQQVFDLLFDAEQHLKQLCLQDNRFKTKEISRNQSSSL